MPKGSMMKTIDATTTLKNTDTMRAHWRNPFCSNADFMYFVSPK